MGRADPAKREFAETEIRETRERLAELEQRLHEGRECGVALLQGHTERGDTFIGLTRRNGAGLRGRRTRQ